MTQLVPGQNIKIASPTAYRLTMGLSGWHWGVIVLRYNQPATHLQADNGLAIVDDQLLINLHDIDDQIERIVVYVNAGSASAQRAAIRADLHEIMPETLYASIFLAESDRSETALNLLEIYKRHDDWKLRVVCQGFNDGLTRLLGLYNLSVQTAESDTRPMTGSIVTGDDAAISMSWSAATGSEHIPSNLYIGDAFNPLADFRIGCFYQLYNGQSGIVYSLNNDLCGSFDGVPYIKASRSDNQHFEQLQINQRYRHKLHRYLVFAIRVEGQQHWKAHNVTMDFQIAGLQSQILTPNSIMVKPIYAAAIITFEKERVILTPVDEYFDNLQLVDQAFGWNLLWHDTN